MLWESTCKTRFVDWFEYDEHVPGRGASVAETRSFAGMASTSERVEVWGRVREHASGRAAVTQIRVLA
jgi:hypothetical protein